MNDERRTWTDPATGCAVTRWTAHDSNHLYL